MSEDEYDDLTDDRRPIQQPTDQPRHGDGQRDNDWSFRANAADSVEADDEIDEDAYDEAPVAGFARRAPVAARPRRRIAGLGRWFAPVLFLAPLLILGLVVFRWWQQQLDPPGDPGETTSFVVKQDWGAKQIGDALDERGVIGSSWAFQMYVRTGSHGPFRAGTYVLHQDEGVRGAVEILEGVATNPLDVRLLRGLRLEQVAKQLAVQIPGTTTKRFLAVARSADVQSRFQPEGVASLEGFLAPGSYTMPRGISERDALEMVVERFDAGASDLGLDEVGDTADAYERIVLASLIEKEAARNDERARIAGVIENRLADGTRLQLDATVLYAVGRDSGFTTDADRAVDSPYNTYRVAGLPPTPIANVSTESLRASMKPERNSFLFYVFKDCDGRHAFAATFDDHVRNTEAARDKGLFDGACS